jgi:hypothetical protein
MRINNINLRTGWAEFKPPHPGDRQVRKCPREGMSFVIKPPILSRPPPSHGVYIDMCINTFIGERGILRKYEYMPLLRIIFWAIIFLTRTSGLILLALSVF